MNKIKAVMNWSGGKDSAHALYKILQSNKYEIVSLLTTINRSTRLSTMHNLPLEILEAQSKHIGIPLKVVGLKPQGNMDDYSEAMRSIVKEFMELGVTDFIFGDIYLNNVRMYREELFTPLGIKVVEPLWDKSSKKIMDEFLETGLKTMIVTTMADGLGKDAIGRIIDRQFIDSLPSTIDPNGENGEYHTFCFEGPIYKSPLSFEIGCPYSKSFEIGMDDGTKHTFTYFFVDLKLRS